jgi:hypothetical protein
VSLHVLATLCVYYISGVYSCRLDEVSESIPGRARDLSALHSTHTGSGAHSASYQKGNGGFFSGYNKVGA